MRITISLSEAHAGHEWFDQLEVSEQKKYIEQHPQSQFAKHALKQAKVAVHSMLHEQRKFFKGAGYKPKSAERRSFGQFIKDKAKGLVHALKHEVHEFKEAGQGVNKFFQGKKMSHEEKKALKTVLIHSALVIGPMAVTGGLSAGLSSVLPSVATHFVEHALVMNVAKVAMFASDDPTDANMQKMLEKFAEYVAEQDLSVDEWKKMFAEQNTK